MNNLWEKRMVWVVTVWLKEGLTMDEVLKLMI